MPVHDVHCFVRHCVFENEFVGTAVRSHALSARVAYRPTPILALLLFIFGAGCVLEPEPEAVGGCSGVTYPDWAASPYVLPVPIGEIVQIDLSNCSGSFHSEGRPDEFGIDFNMPIGTQITSSRAGEVVWVEESGDDGRFPNNLVVVDHGDGSFAQYMHLTRDGAAVEVGDLVVPGSPIGLSGATGLAGYPHLHFVVTSGGHEFPYVSVPVTFRNTAPNPKSLLSGQRYTALAY